MKIAFCASEAVPFAKTGGMADVCGALPLELKRLGQDVIVIMPAYKVVADSGVVLRHHEDFAEATVAEGLRFFFIKHESFLRLGLYGDQFGDYSDNLQRFAWFCSKALELFSRIKFDADIIHCHDWQTSLIPVYVDAGLYSGKKRKKPRTLLTIHNMAYQGIFPKEQMFQTGLAGKYFSVNGLEYFDQINLLKGGVRFADRINTVSETYGRDIQTKEYGCGLEGILVERKAQLSGILNGIDYKVWNPQGDSLIFKPYSGQQVQEKVFNKAGLQEALGFPRNEKSPLFGFVGRLVEQKGMDLLIETIPEFCRRGWQIVLLGLGDASYEIQIKELTREHPSQVHFHFGFNETLAHRIYAASDIFLMPSRFEPCGIGQLISLKYGTVPVVYRTGGLADTIEDYDLKDGSGNGFVFSKYDVPSFLIAVERAVALFADDARWQALMKRNMNLNFSWKESAKKYCDLYSKLKRH